MKFSTAVLFLLVGSVSAGVDINLNLKHGSHPSLQSAVAPEISFSGTAEDVDLEYGGSVDIASEGLPKSIWGKKRASVGGWNLDGKVELSQGKFDYGDDEDVGAYLTVTGADEDEETFVYGSGAASQAGVKPLKVGVKKVFPGKAANFMTFARYDFEQKVPPTVVLGVEQEDTQAYLILSEEDQDVVIQHQINDDNSAKIRAGVSTGFIHASVTNDSDLGTTVVTARPEDWDVEIKKDGWKAGINCLWGVGEPTIRFSKNVDLGGVFGF